MKARIIVFGIDIGVHEVGRDGLAAVQDNLEVIFIDEESTDKNKELCAELK